MSAGRSIEIYKEADLPTRVRRRFALHEIAGSHALGHTRMATESRVTTAHSHPFSTGLDLCLVHNGSLSNHNRLRRTLQREGIVFRTENDSEVAAGYLTWRLREGASLEQALEGCLDDLDGFYTFAVGHGRRVRGAARPDRVQAGGDGRDRRMGGDGVRVPGDRRASGRRGRRHVGARPGARLQLGHRVAGGVMATPEVTREALWSFDLAEQTVRDLNAYLHAGSIADAASARVVVLNPGGRHAIAVGLDAPYDVEIEGHVGYYCAGHEQARDGARARQLRRRAWPRT